MAARHDNFRFSCRNNGCNFQTGVRRLKLEDFEATQYRGGFPCEKCGFPRMRVMRTNKIVKDGFKPGLQRSIMKHCDTYAEYKAWLKKLDLVEIGYEELNPDSEVGPINYWDDETVREICRETGVTLDENLVRHLQDINDEIHKDA